MWAAPSVTRLLYKNVNKKSYLLNKTYFLVRLEYLRNYRSLTSPYLCKPQNSSTIIETYRLLSTGKYLVCNCKNGDDKKNSAVKAAKTTVAEKDKTDEQNKPTVVQDDEPTLVQEKKPPIQPTDINKEPANIKVILKSDQDIKNQIKPVESIPAPLKSNLEVNSKVDSKKIVSSPVKEEPPKIKLTLKSDHDIIEAAQTKPALNSANEDVTNKQFIVKKEGSLAKSINVKAELDKDKKVANIILEKVKGQSPPARKRLLIDFSASYTERNFITPMRAMTEYLLKQSDLESLPKVLRRSPYEFEPPMTVYYRKDVEAKSIAIWGSKEKLDAEILRREIDRRRYEQDVITVKRRLRTYRREMSQKKKTETGLSSRSGRVVLTAVAINGCNFLFKLCTWWYTGSHSMFSESIHSLADTINQLILVYGIHKSVQMADADHPYGYTNMRYVSSLISGVGIFCVGSGLSFYHGILGIWDPQPLQDLYWAYFVLGGAAVSEGATLMVAISAIRKGAKEANVSFKEYVLRSSDPSVNVVLLEDTAAVAGLIMASSCMAISQLTGSPLPDAIGSLLVGTVLGTVASFIILSNVGALIGRSIPYEKLDEINLVLERDFMIRAIHDVKGIDIGSNLIRYKAEVDFDGRALTRSYLEKQDLNLILEDARKLVTIDDVEAFLLKHGENIVDMLGGEIDRIELKLRKQFPQIRHCDLEIL